MATSINRDALRAELTDVLKNHVVDGKPAVVVGYFINVVEAFNNRQAPSSVPLPENVATTS
jgi:hypothetical protein